MQPIDLSVITQLCSWLKQGNQTWLCTVIHTWGSAPRLPGSLLACDNTGVIVGSLSGGCIEENLIEQLREGRLATSGAEYKIYGETPSDIERFKLPCGGTLGILIEPICTKQLHNFQRIESALQQRQTICRQHDWKSNTTVITHSNAPPSVSFDHDSNRHPLRLKQVYGPATHLFIIGICEVSRVLAQFALTTGYRVSVCDPRAQMKEQWNIENTTLITAMPDDAIRQYAADANSAIVAVTHDPRIDDMGLMDAFNTDAFFIGAMGSQKTSERRRQRLQQLGVSKEQLKRLHAPIGVNIHSKTPAEIAIAIMAQLITLRAESLTARSV